MEQLARLHGAPSVDPYCSGPLPFPDNCRNGTEMLAPHLQFPLGRWPPGVMAVELVKDSDVKHPLIATSSRSPFSGRRQSMVRLPWISSPF